MENFVIRGGHELFGEVNISGAKNAAVAIIPAAILANDIVRIENIPNISDVSLMIQTLDRMGAKIKLINNNTRKVYNIRSLNPFLDCKIVVSSTGTYKYISPRESIIIEIMQIRRFCNYITLIMYYNYIRGLNDTKVQDINIVPDLEVYDKVVMTKEEIEKKLGYEIIIKD